MSPNKISSDLQRFIFENIDSIGFLEALLLLKSNPSKSWTPATLARELRNNPVPVAQYLKKLKGLGLVQKNPDSGEFFYDDSKAGFRQTIVELAECYRVQRHRIYELVYSPLKKVRDFSDAFLLPGSNGKKGENDG